jgi:hypothetical protein
MLRSFWRRLMARKSHSPGRVRYRPNFLHPMLELLEDRLAPATVTINTVNLTVNGSSNTIYGTPFTASVVNGVAVFKCPWQSECPGRRYSHRHRLKRRRVVGG